MIVQARVVIAPYEGSQRGTRISAYIIAGLVVIAPYEGSQPWALRISAAQQRVVIAPYEGSQHGGRAARHSRGGRHSSLRGIATQRVGLGDGQRAASS